jgi:hypothetical protein
VSVADTEAAEGNFVVDIAFGSGSIPIQDVVMVLDGGIVPAVVNGTRQRC